MVTSFLKYPTLLVPVSAGLMAYYLRPRPFNRKIAYGLGTASFLATLLLLRSHSSATVALVLSASMLNALVCLLLAPEAEWREGAALRVFLLQASTLGVALLSNLLLVTAFWVLAPFAVLWEGRESSWRARGAFAFHQGLSSLFFLGAASVLVSKAYFATGILGHALNLEFSEACGVDALAGGLFALACWLRLGLFPFHASVLALSEGAPLSGAIPFLSSQIGIIAMARLGLPLGQWATVGATVGALYFSVLATAQTDPRRLAVLLSLCATSIGLVGLWGRTTVSVTGAALQFFSAAISAAALGGTAWLVHSRVGKNNGGLAHSLPGLAGFFLLFGLAISGMPGGIGFIASEMILGKWFFTDGVTGPLLLAAIMFSLVAAYSCYVRVFLGPPGVHMKGIDLLSRERFALLLLLLALAVPSLLARPVSEWIGATGEKGGLRAVENSPADGQH